MKGRQSSKSKTLDQCKDPQILASNDFVLIVATNSFVEWTLRECFLDKFGLLCFETDYYLYFFLPV
jgi:hypothetical protein